MRKQRNYAARMLSPDPSVSSMRWAVMVCVIAALIIALDAVVMWNLWLFGVITKPFEIGAIVGLVGTLLSPLVPKAIQSFSRNDHIELENEEEITVRGDLDESE